MSLIHDMVSESSVAASGNANEIGNDKSGDEVDAAVQVDTEVNSSVDTSVDTKADPDPDADAGVDADVDADVDAGVDAEAEAEAGVDTKADADADANPQSSTIERPSTRRSSKRRKRQQPDANGLQKRLKTAEHRLKDKEALVSTLTNQLEQAAEQLDRIHRTGSDRQIRVPSSTMPADLVEQQQLMLDELQQAIQRWDDVQAGLALERIERDLSEVRDLVSGSVRIGGQTHTSPFVSGSHDNDSDDGDASDSTDTDKGEAPSLAAALALAFKSDDSGGVGTPTAATDESSNKAQPGGHPDTEAELLDSESADEDVSLPVPIDYAAADTDQLITAIEHRDRYISLLIRKLRIAERRSQPAGHWSELAEVPDELRSVLEELESRLNETARMAELDLSLERARLAREESKLRTLEQRLQQQSKQFERCTEESNDCDDDSRASRRWLRFIGK